jgi:hypothetical protein
MDEKEIIEKLKLLIATGVRIGAIEKKLCFPENNLSGVLSGKRILAERWKPKFEQYLNDLEKPSTFPYLISEQEGQLMRMASLDVPIDSGATFEQLVNTVIFLAGDYKGKLQELEKKMKEAGKSEMIPPHPKREDFEDSLQFGAAKSEWKKKYNL